MMPQECIGGLIGACLLKLNGKNYTKTPHNNGHIKTEYLEDYILLLMEVVFFYELLVGMMIFITTILMMYIVGQVLSIMIPITLGVLGIIQLTQLSALTGDIVVSQ